MQDSKTCAVAAIQSASSLIITINKGDVTEEEIPLEGEELCKTIAIAIKNYYARESRIVSRRKSLEEAFAAVHHGPALIKHVIKGYNIHDWEELDDLTLSEIKEYLLNESGCCKNSIKCYCGCLSLIISKYRRAYNIPCSDDFRSILKIGNDSPHKIYLDQTDLIRFEITKPKTKKEHYVHMMFLVSAYTGCRISDAERLTRENVIGNKIVYVSQKTRVQASIPLKPKVLKWLEWIWDNPTKISVQGYNDALRRLCKQAGASDSVNVYRAGENINGEKWRFVSSHTARISFATNMSLCGTPIQHIAQMMGHTDTKTTLHYIVSQKYSLTAGAQIYLE